MIWFDIIYLMNKRKIAFLLDFDGPFFNSELLEAKTMQFFGISKGDWHKVYKSISQNSRYVDIGEVFAVLSQQMGYPETAIWDYLLKNTQPDEFCSKENRDTLIHLAHIGHIELITQGNTKLQKLKLETSGVQTLLDNDPQHTIKIIPHEKITHLKARLQGLVEDGYVVIQMDDRVEPLSVLHKFALVENMSHSLYQYRIHTGKYTEVKNPYSHTWKDFPSMSMATRDIILNLLPSINKEGQTHARMIR